MIRFFSHFLCARLKFTSSVGRSVQPATVMADCISTIFPYRARTVHYEMRKIFISAFNYSTRNDSTSYGNPTHSLRPTTSGCCGLWGSYGRDVLPRAKEAHTFAVSCCRFFLFLFGQEVQSLCWDNASMLQNCWLSNADVYFCTACTDGYETDIWQGSIIKRLVACALLHNYESVQSSRCIRHETILQ